MAIRQGLTQADAQMGRIAIIDSLPNPLCHKVRNKRAKEHNSVALKRLRRTIEARFAVLVDNYGIEHNLTRSVIGFWLKIELTVFVYNLGFFDFVENGIIIN